ncbi:DUF4394 domain-containing protein [Lacibacterium aquatile]|uniref:DUF4394 domain-containing protein n=1 Tax=Lacibacterium aquatile TaxID=1168082 RepID=A0ABW5DR55_9PROT
MKAALAIASASLLLPLVANAAQVAALTSDNHLLMIDSVTRTASKPTLISGVDSRLVGIDVRPADGKLYGLSAKGSIYTLDPVSGRGQMISKLSVPFDAGSSPIVDFNPVADRLRVVAAGGTNLRVKIDDGATTVDKPLTYQQGGDRAVLLAGGAYTNSMAGAKETALYHLDAGQNAWLLQAPPNDGILQVKGPTGIPKQTMAAFDIASDGKGGNQGWLLTGSTLHQVDVATWKTSTTGALKGLGKSVVDIAVLP